MKKRLAIVGGLIALVIFGMKIRQGQVAYVGNAGEAGVVSFTTTTYHPLARKTQFILCNLWPDDGNKVALYGATVKHGVSTTVEMSSLELHWR